MALQQDIGELAKSVKLRPSTTKDMIKKLKTDLLLSLYRAEPNKELLKVQILIEQNNNLKQTNEELLLEAQVELDALNERNKDEKESKNSNPSKIKVLERSIKNAEKEVNYLQTIVDNTYQKSTDLKLMLKQALKTEEFNYEVNGKIAALYEDMHNKKFNFKLHKKNKKLPLFLMGPPGQGKTAAYFVVGKEICAELGLNFISHVKDDYVPSRKDLIMVVQECAGENSAITFGGIPRAEEVIGADGIKKTVLKKAVNHRFSVFDGVFGGILLFDDAANAPSVIQNVLLPVAQNGTFQGLEIPNALFGFTGNLGSLDGTYTSDQSSALLTRVVPYFVSDTLKDFCDRSYEYYNDELGDMGYVNFLMRNAKDFAQLPEPGQKSGFACSRSHDNLIQQIRGIVEKNGGRGVGEAKSLDEIHGVAVSCLGQEIGMKVQAYYDSYMRGADPLAKEFIVHGNMNKEKFQKEYDGGASSESMSFGYQFATACGDYAVSQIGNADKPMEVFNEIAKRYGKAILQLNDSEFGYALEHFKNKLAAYVSDFSIATTSKRELKPEIRELIAKAIIHLEDCSLSKAELCTSVITDMDKYNKSGTVANRAGGRKLNK